MTAHDVESIDVGVGCCPLVRSDQPRWPAWSILSLAALSAGVGVASGPLFRANQNTYLLHAVAPSYESLRSDWLLGTTDPFPVFTWVARLVFTAGGLPGLVLFTVLLSTVAFASLASIGHSLARRTFEHEQHVWSPALAVLVLSAVWHLRSHLPILGIGWIETFGGFGGQYILSNPGRLQPSDSGVLLLAVMAMCFAGVVERRGPLLVAGALVALTCSLHPSYLAPVLIALGSMAFADLAVAGTRERVPAYVAIVAAAVGLLLVTNRVARSFGSGPSDAQAYLSFERVPHHTLISQWVVAENVTVAVVIVLGIAASRHLTGTWWLGVAMSAALIASLFAAILVEITRSTTLASTFPWRVSVVLVPLASLMVVLIVVEFVTRSLSQPVLVAVTGATAALLVGSGSRAVWAATHDVQPDVVEWLREQGPSGVGLVPLDFQEARLNARVPIFVDRKSHPYEGQELAEWVRRVKAAEAVEAEPGRLCDFVETESIDWVLTVTVEVPACLASWSIIEHDDIVLLVRS